MTLNASFIEEREGIYRLKVPFEDLYTSVFLIKTDEKNVLMDCATTAFDVDFYILPALLELGYSPREIDLLVLSHRHDDHAGGSARLLELAPGIETVTEIRSLSGELFTYPMAGHTEDSIGIFDARTHTLLSGDGLQGAGVGRFACYTKNAEAYLQTLARIGEDERIECILFSHAYEPWRRDRVQGRREICDCLLECRRLAEQRWKSLR